MILAGRVEQYAKGDIKEWPYTASEALDSLIEELQDARQERSRFDTFIRTQTFLDQLTGTANEFYSIANLRLLYLNMVLMVVFYCCVLMIGSSCEKSQVNKWLMIL